jgi:T5SS/PEP-CTERM-associated repeat protein
LVRAGDVTVTGNASIWFIDEDLVVGDAGIGTLTIDSRASVTSFDAVVGMSSTGTVTIDGQNSYWTNNGSLTVGYGGSGTLSIKGGGRLFTTFSGDRIIGDLAGSTGDVTVTGQDSTWTSTDKLIVGNSGKGTLSVTNKGQVSSAGGIIGALTGSEGTVTIDDATWTMTGSLDIGAAGQGNVTLSAGGQLITGTAVAFGVVRIAVQDLGDITSTVTVDGAGSKWTNATQDLNVGYTGKATLTISNGGQVLNKVGAIGQEPTADGMVTVADSGSTWTNNGLLTVGDQGMGKLQITNGGMVSAGTFARVANNHDAEVTVDGMGSTWDIVEDLKLGVLKAAKMTITNGGQVNSMSGILGINAGSMGTVTIDGMDANANPSSWIIENDLDIDRGKLTVSNGGTVVATNVTVRAAGELKGDGNVIGDVGNSGLVSPGTSTGALHVDGDYTQTVDGELLIELASGSSFDQLLVTSTATLAGTVDVSLLDGFAIRGERFLPILTAANVMGQFDTELLPSVPDVTFDLIYNPTSVVLHIVAPLLAGDYNGNGTVDAADYVVWRKNDGTQAGYDTWRANFGASAAGPSLPGDFNGNGTVDAADYVVWRKGLGTTYTQNDYNTWRANFGATASAGTGAAGASPSHAGVPEPATLVLLIFAAAGWIRRRG